MLLQKISQYMLKKSPIVVFFAGLALFVSLGLAYHHYAGTVKHNHYQAFNFGNTFSWEEDKGSIYRIDSKGDFDNYLLSFDRWSDVTMAFTVSNPHEAGIVFHYQSLDDFYFIYFNQEKNGIALIHAKEGQMIPRSQAFLKEGRDLAGRLQISRNQCRVFIDGNLVMSARVDRQEGQIGLLIKEMRESNTVFKDLFLTGRLSNGAYVSSGAKEKSFVQMVKQTAAFFISYFFILACATYLALTGFYIRNRKQKSQKPVQEYIHSRSAALIHFILAVILFYPFIFKGHVFVSSTDNYAQIYPLFFYCKQVFIQVLKGESWGLWNPYMFNGMPFYMNHWQMMYYPLNWFVFLASDQYLFLALTARQFLEVFLAGFFAYKFFELEIHNKRWALFSSVCYQLCSLLIFSLSVFSAISLYWCIPLYLYLLWSMPKRKAHTNFFLLSLTVYTILTTANMAFVFYGVLTLFIISIYRIASIEKHRKEQFIILSTSIITGFFLGAIRILSCFFGIIQSNRIDTDYAPMLDRLPMITRLFIPEIAGGNGAFNALTTKTLAPLLGSSAHSQIIFFVYFGIVAALLLITSLFIPSKGGFKFWKFYTLFALSVGLLIEPIWGMVSILFFPFNHHHYNVTIIPLGVCALLGFTGMALEQRKFSWKGIKSKFFIVLFIVQAYIASIVVHLFPGLTVGARIILISFIVWLAIYWILNKTKKTLAKFYMQSSLFVTENILYSITLFVSTVAIIRPIPIKRFIFEGIVIPEISLLLIIFLALRMLATLLTQQSKKDKRYKYWWVGSLLGIPVLTLVFLFSPIFDQLNLFSNAHLTYLLNVALAESKFILITCIALTALVLVKTRFFTKGFYIGFLIFITIIDLLAFQLCFNGIVAPTHKRQAFLEDTFPYRDVEARLKNRMDLVNFRVNRLNKTGLGQNSNLLFGIPSYTGIAGYISERFAHFISRFGYSSSSAFIYPVDSTNNQRFLDLSSVKYEFVSPERMLMRPNALARMSLFYNYEIIQDEQALLQRLGEDTFNPQKTVLLSEKINDKLFLKARDRAAQPVPIVESGSDYAQVFVRSKTPAIVLFNESFNEGWQAYVDGVKVATLAANYNFLGCVVPEGRHTVSFRFEPPKFYLALTLSLIGLVLLVVGTRAFYIKRWGV